PHRIRRPHAAQPRSAGRGARAGRRPSPVRPARRDSRRRPRRRHPRVGVGRRRHLATGAHRDRRQHPRPAARTRTRALARPVSRSVEQELKLLAPDELLLPRFDDLGLTPGPPESRVLVATYLDTPDLRLARSGASLRWRDDEACWVVKLPSRSASDVLTRDTYGFDGPLSTPAPAAVKLVTAIVRRVPLDVVARLTTRRTRIPLCDPHGKAVLEIDDDRVEAETMNGPVTFREIEAELLADDSSDRVLDDIRGRLQAVGAQKSDGLPK